MFGEIARYAHTRFEIDRAAYRISTTLQEAGELEDAMPEDWEMLYLNTRAGRQLLHVTYGSVLTAGRTAKGQPFKEAILETLQYNTDLYTELLTTYFTEHLQQLNAG